MRAFLRPGPSLRPSPSEVASWQMIFIYLGGVDGNNNFENLNLTVWGQIFY